jgi:membrane dipeptidase
MANLKEAKDLNKESLILDIHCHPSLKIDLLKYKIYENEHFFKPILGIPFGPIKPDSNDGILPMQYDLNQIKAGGVRGIWSSVYALERGVVDNSELLGTGECIIQGLQLGFDQVIESNNTFTQAMQTMEIIETQIGNAPKRFNATFTKSFSDFKQAIDNGKTCFVHTLEGAHMLGRNLTEEQYISNLNNMATWGVCSMTLAHFMPNDLCYPVQGIAPNARRTFGFSYNYNQFNGKGLKTIGKRIVNEMLDIGMIIDLNHITPAGRSEIFNINEARAAKKRPLTFTHNGIRKTCAGELITQDEEEIKIIKKCNGVIGIIFMNYWLNKSTSDHENGVQYAVQTILNIAEICKDQDGKPNYSHISIGSDLDGFTTPMGDLYCASKMPLLTQAMLNAGISEENIKKVLGLNALRVMEEGWGKI